MSHTSPLLSLVKADVRDGDRLILRLAAEVEPEVAAMLKQAVKDWAGCDVAVLVLHPESEITLEIERHGDTQAQLAQFLAEQGSQPEGPRSWAPPATRVTESDRIALSLCPKCGNPAMPMHMRAGVCVMCLAAAGAGDDLQGRGTIICANCGRPFVPDDTHRTHCPPCLHAATAPAAPTSLRGLRT